MIPRPTECLRRALDSSASQKQSQPVRHCPFRRAQDNRTTGKAGPTWVQSYCYRLLYLCAADIPLSISVLLRVQERQPGQFHRLPDRQGWSPRLYLYWTVARHSNFARVKYQAIVFKAIKNVRWAINLDKKTAVVTAGAGFIGSNLCQELSVFPKPKKSAMIRNMV